MKKTTKFLVHLTSIGRLSTDSHEIRLRKRFMIYLTALMSVGGLVWGSIALANGLYLAAVIPFIYLVFSAANLTFFAIKKNFKLVSHMQTIVSLSFPFIFQILIGGFHASGATMLWALLFLVASLLFLPVKDSKCCIILFIGFTIITGLLDNYAHQFQPEMASYVPTLFIVLNIVFTSSIVYFLVIYFVDGLQKAQHMVQKQTKSIQENIRYAKRIQEAILPPEKMVKKFLKENFIVYKPKDIVAGDFYWMETLGDNTIFAAADCTGHGVSGAMVSIVCYNALNRSIREYGLTKPSDILNKTRELVAQTFDRHENSLTDGMDVAVCTFNTKTNKMQYAGANSPLYLVKKVNGTKLDAKVEKNDTHYLHEIKGDRQPIGKQFNMAPFTNHTIELKEGETIYLSSDGFADQFGGEEGSRFKSRALKRLLLSVNQNSMDRQGDLVDKKFETWKGEHEQVDDVCLIGIKVA